MIQFLKNLFAGDQTPSVEELLKEGATIVDVRSVAEYAGGHLNNSVNIPLDQLKGRLNEIDKDKPVITCCASGIRSASAKKVLLSNGFSPVRNGGGWGSLQKFDS